MGRMLGERAHAAVYGAAAAVIGAACMTVLRGGMRRAGLIERTVPQVIEETLTSGTRARSEVRDNFHPVLEQAIHFAYGAGVGAAYGALVGESRDASIPRGLLLAASVWAIGGAVVIPGTGAHRPAWRRALAENAVDLAAHVVFGLATELVREDLLARAQPGDAPRWERVAAITG